MDLGIAGKTALVLGAGMGVWLASRNSPSFAVRTLGLLAGSALETRDRRRLAVELADAWERTRPPVGDQLRAGHEPAIQELRKGLLSRGRLAIGKAPLAGIKRAVQLAFEHVDARQAAAVGVAWRVSAHAAGDALATLRAALRIPGAVEDLPVSLRLQQGPGVAAVRHALGGG